MPRPISFALSLLGAALATQAPEFAQQYRQRLGGAIDELRGMVAQFDAEASFCGLGLAPWRRRLSPAGGVRGFMSVSGWLRLAPSCRAGTIGVYRAYNNRFAFKDSNHRHTTELSTYNSMLAQGWVGEGIVFCASE